MSAVKVLGLFVMRVVSNLVLDGLGMVGSSAALGAAIVTMRRL